MTKATNSKQNSFDLLQFTELKALCKDRNLKQITTKLSVTLPKPKKVITEAEKLNYQIITFLLSDVIAELEDLRDLKVIETDKIWDSYLRGYTDMDMEKITKEYEISGRAEKLGKDYSDLIDFFKALSSKFFSDYEKTADPYLERLYYCIYVIEYFKTLRQTVANIWRVTVEKKITDAYDSVLSDLKKTLVSRHSKIANKKFQFKDHSSFFNSFKTISTKELNILIDEILCH